MHNSMLLVAITVGHELTSITGSLLLTKQSTKFDSNVTLRCVKSHFLGAQLVY